MSTDSGTPVSGLPGWLRRLGGSRPGPGSLLDLADILEDLELVVWEAVPPDFAVEHVSSSAERVFGYPVSVWLEGAGIWEKLIHPDDLDRVKAHRESTVESEGRHELEYRVVTSEGATLWVRSAARVRAGADGRPRLCGVMQDVTRRRAAETSALENQERVRRLLDHAADALLVHDTQGRLVEVNQTACDVLGYTRAQLLGLEMAAIEVGFEHARATASWQQLEPGRSETSDTEYRRADGSTFPAEVRIGLFEWDGRPLVVAIARDTSERKKLEQQLRHSQKMEAVGRLAGGVAHDFNNLLTAIKGHAELLLATEDGDGQTHKDLSEISRAADRATALTRKLLAFSRQQVFAPEVLDLNRIVLDTCRLLRPLVGEHIDFRTELGDIGRIRADPGQLEQVLVNLVVNSRDAMTEGGQLTIATGNLDVTSRNPFRHPFVRAGSYVELRVTDTGHGMDAATAARIFEPFFTTKEKGKGSGLGLAIAYGIVKQSGGYLIVETEPARGTTCLVILPRSEAEIPAPQPAEPRQAAARNGGVVLVVEDEAPVRALVCRVLAKEGFRTLEAENGEEALARVREFSGRVDLIITDVIMPGMGGRALAQAVAARHSGIRVLLMSGFADAPPPDGRTGSEPLLQKPFTPAELARRVRQTLGA